MQVARLPQWKPEGCEQSSTAFRLGQVWPCDLEGPTLVLLQPGPFPQGKEPWSQGDAPTWSPRLPTSGPSPRCPELWNFLPQQH